MFIHFPFSYHQGYVFETDDGVLARHLVSLFKEGRWEEGYAYDKYASLEEMRNTMGSFIPKIELSTLEWLDHVLHNPTPGFVLIFEHEMALIKKHVEGDPS